MAEVRMPRSVREDLSEDIAINGPKGVEMEPCN